MAYKDHTMGKGKARVTTKNQEAHNALEELGWGHSPFKLKEVHYNSPVKCWKSHERKPGTTKGAKGSCQHKDPSQRPK